MTTPAHIGSVAIRVSPDASKFREELKKTLERVEKTARVKVSPVIDNQAKRKVQSEINAIKGTDATVSVKTDAASFTKTQAQLNSLSKVSVDKIDISNAALAKARTRLSRSLSPNVHPNVNSLAARTELARLARPIRVPIRPDLKGAGFTNLARTLARSTKRAVSSASDGMAAATRATTTLLGSLRGLATNGLQRVGTAARGAASAFRALTSAMTGTLRGALGVGKALGRTSALVGAITPALSGLLAVGLPAISSGVQGATTAVAGLWVALTKLTPLLGTLPALIGGGVAGFVALRATVKTAKDALADYGDVFTQMYDNIGQAAWSVGGEQVIRTTERLIPVLDAGMQKVGAAFGSMMGKVAAQIASPRSLGAIADVLDHTAAAMEPLGDALAWVVDGLLQLARAGAPMLVRMAQYTRRLASNFSAWANEVYATGRMFVWVDEAIHTLMQLGRIISGLGGTFAALGRTMGVTAGGDALDRLVAGVESMERAVNSPIFQRALITMFAGADAALRTLRPSLTYFAHTLAALTPLFSRLMVTGSAALGALLRGFSDLIRASDVQRGVESMFAGVLAAAQDLRRFIPTLAPLLGNLARLIGVILAAVGDLLPSLRPLLSVLTRLAASVGPAVVTVVRDLGAALSDPALVSGVDAFVRSVVHAITTLSALLPVLGPVVGVLLRLAGGSFTSLADGLTPVVNSFAPVISQLARQLLPVVQRVIAQLSAALSDPRLVGGVASLGEALIEVIGIAGDLLPTLAPIIGVLARLAGTVATALAGALVPLLETFAPVVTQLAQSLMPVVQMLADTLAQALTDPALVGGLQTFLNTLVGLIPVIANLLPVLAPVLGTLLGAVAQVVDAIVRGLAPVIEMLAPYLQRALSVIAPILTQIIGVVANALTYLPRVFTVIGGVFARVFEPLKQAWAEIKPQIAAAWQYITDLFSGIDFGAAFATLGTALQPVVDMLRSLKDGVVEIVEIVGPMLMDLLGGIITNILPTMFEGYRQIFDLIRDAIGPTFGALAPAMQPFLDTLGEVYQLFINNVVPLWGVVIRAIQVAAEIIGALLPPILAVVGAIAHGVDVILQSLFPVVERAFQWITLLIEPLRETFELLANALIPVIDWLAEKIEALQPLLTRVVDFLGTVLLNAVEFIRDIVGVITSIIQGDWSQAWQYAKDAVGEVMEVIGNLLLDLPGVIWEAVKALAGILWDAGAHIAENLLSGIMDALRRGRDAVWNGIKSLFGQGDDSVDDSWLRADPGFGQPSTRASADAINRGNTTRTGGTQTINIYNPVNEPSSETLRRNSAHMTGGY